jgi:simple sugar transport system permease protein
MMNSVAMCLTLFFMKLWSKDSSSVGNTTLDPYEKIHHVFSSNYFFVIISVLILTAAMYIYLNYSKHGYEISVVGESENTARYVGINVKKVIIRTMIISGLICGFAGFLIVAPSQSIADSIVKNRGFTAIMVAWLAKFNPVIMILSAFLFIFVSAGGQQISTTLGYDSAYSDIFVGILLFFIIGCEFFISYKLVPGGKLKEFISKHFTKKQVATASEEESK